MEEEEPKHSKFEARRAKFEKRRRYGGASATFKRTWFNCRDRDWELDIKRPENEEFLVMSSEVDDLYNLPASGPHGLAEHELEEFLENLSDEYIPQESFSRYGKKVTIFRLPATGWKVGKHTAAGQRARFDRLQIGVGGMWTPQTPGQYWTQTQSCKVLTRIMDTPLDSIVDPCLLDKHSLSCSASSKGTRPENAHINNNCVSSCWSPPLTDLKTHYLQVDLACDCEVTYISTQGRFPPLLKFPLSSICAFTGAQIMDEQDSEMHQWVWKYEVVARVDSGRTWFSLGVFNGNRDMTTEVAHKLLFPVQCRYLRFHVLGYDRVPAMRVGVYGRRPGGTAQKKVSDKQMVEYRFEGIAQNMCLKRVPVGSPSADVSHGYHCPFCRSYTGGCLGGRCCCKKRHRHLRRLAARKLVPEAVGLLHSEIIPRTSTEPCALAGPSSIAIATSQSMKGGFSRLIINDRRQADVDNEISEGWILI